MAWWGVEGMPIVGRVFQGPDVVVTHTSAKKIFFFRFFGGYGILSVYAAGDDPAGRRESIKTEVDMEIHKFNPYDIMVPEVRVTSRFDEDTLAQFKQSIGADPAAVYIICAMIDGKPVLVDGLHRLTEALHAHWPTIDAVLIQGDMIDVLTLNLKLDHLRGKHPPSEMVKVIEALTTEYGLDSEKIAAKTGLSRDYIEKIQSITRLTPLIRAALDEDKIKIGHAYALTRISDPVIQETVFYQQQIYHWGVKEIELYIVDLLNIKPAPGAAPGAPPAPVKIKCAYCGEEHDPRDGQIANPNTCQVCAGILFAATAQARREAAAEAESQHAGGQAIKS